MGLVVLMDYIPKLVLIAKRSKTIQKILFHN